MLGNFLKIWYEAGWDKDDDIIKWHEAGWGNPFLALNYFEGGWSAGV